MSYKTVLVHLDRGKRTAQRVDLALGLAGTFDSHLVGLFALSAPRIPSYALAEAGPAVLEAEAQYRAEAAKAAEKVFRDAVAKRGHGRSEWRVSSRDALGAVQLSARYADLVVIGQYEPDVRAGVAQDFPEEVVLSTGRPVLIVPYAGKFPAIGRRVLVAWNTGREAARSLADALPLLARAQTVHLASFNPREGDADHGEVPGADIALTLARHGVKVAVEQQTSEHADVGNQILSRAADLQVDLIVMGAYGHARLRQLVLGGVTRTLLETMTVPVLMSH